MDIVSVDAGDMDSPAHSPAYEALLEVVTRADEKGKVGLPFFPTSTLRSWKRLVEYRVFGPQTSNFSNIMGLKQHDYGALPKVEEMLSSYISPDSASSLKSLTLPSKPLRKTSALVGKAYSPMGQAAACLHTLSILQEYQADLLGDT